MTVQALQEAVAGPAIDGQRLHPSREVYVRVEVGDGLIRWLPVTDVRVVFAVTGSFILEVVTGPAVTS